MIIQWFFNPTRRYALFCLVTVGLFFYSSYGVTNWLSAQRIPLPEVVFSWEYSIPFVAWTIIPYWSLNFFYALAFFLCKDKTELHRYILQLLCAQIIAVIGFTLFPLQFSWEKPLPDGFLGHLFTALASFDAPYNQAPSLHVILTMIVGRFYWSQLSGMLRSICVLWSVLIIFSVLTTYQHHFIDIPTGIIAGAWVWWLFHDNHQPRLSTLPKVTASRLGWAKQYVLLSIVVAIATIGLSLSQGLTWLALGWLSVSFLLLAVIYRITGPSGFQKQPNGKHNLATIILLFPYYLIFRINIWYWLTGKKYYHHIDSNLTIGSITQIKNFAAVFDVCAEYPVFKAPPSYVSFPMLDMVEPSTESLLNASMTLNDLVSETKGRILVCCALGYSRSAAVILVYLMIYKTLGFDDAMNYLQASGRGVIIAKQTKSSIQKAVRLYASTH